MKVKVCGITTKDDLLALEKLGIDYAGFIFYEQSKRFAGNKADTFLPDNSIKIKKTGVFVDAPVDQVLSRADRLQLNYIQLHGKESPAYCESIRKKLPVIKAFNIDEQFSFPSLYDYRSVCDYFLFDAKGKFPGGNNISFNWNLLGAYQLTTPFFLSGGISPQHLPQVLTFSHPAFYGIDVNSGFEISPGIKNIPVLEKFIQHLNTAA